MTFKIHIAIGIAIGLWLILAIGSMAGITPTDITRMTWAGKPVQTEASIIKNNGTDLIALQDLATIVNGHISYDRKFDFYTIESWPDKHKIVIVPNSREIWINGKRNYFSQQTLYFENLLYLPLKEAERFLTTQVKPVPPVSNKPSPPKPPSKGPTPSKIDPESVIATIIPVTIDEDDAAKPDRLPSLDTTPTINLRIEGVLIDLKPHLILRNNTWYIAAEAALSASGFTIKSTANTITLSDGLAEWRFTPNSPAVKVNQSGSESLSQPVLVENKTVYLPFLSLFDLLGYELRVDPTGTRFSAINAIQMIRIIKNGQRVSVDVKTSRHLMIAPTVEWESQREVSLLLPGAAARFKTTQFNTICPEIRSLSIVPTLNRSTEIQLNLTQSLYPLLSQTQNQTTLTMAGVLRDLKQKQIGNQIIVEISASTPLSYTTKNIQDRMIIDFPDMFNYLDINTHSAKSSLFKQIRSSTLAYSPLSSRVVFDMNTQTTPKFEQPNPNQLNIIFDVPNGYQPATISAAKGPLDGKLIAIDPGHGGTDPGSIAANGVYEKVFTRDISDRLITLIQGAGGSVIDLRNGDSSPTLGVRTTQANEANADLFLSIHINAFTKPYANGTQTYYYKPEDKALAKLIHKEILKQLGLKDDKVRRARLYVLRFSTMPATLIEPLYISNPDEFKLLDTPEIRQKIAQAVLDGTIKYFKER